MIRVLHSMSGQRSVDVLVTIDGVGTVQSISTDEAVELASALEMEASYLDHLGEAPDTLPVPPAAPKAN